MDSQENIGEANKLSLPRKYLAKKFKIESYFINNMILQMPISF